MRWWWITVVNGVTTGVWAAAFAPLYGNDPAEVFFKGFTVGALIVPPVFMALERGRRHDAS